MARVADPGRAVVDVTDGRFTDTDPVFTADGKYLAFLSVRSFDPVYDTHVFDLSFPYGCRPYLVPLAAGTPSPFAPLPGGRPVGGRAEDDAADRPGQAEPDESGRGEEEPAAQDGKREDATPAVVVDTAGLAGRVGRFEPTSQVCSACGVKDGPKPLAVRTWQCASCGAVHDRDINAAKNILAAGRADRLTACGGDVRPGPALAVAGEAGTHRSAA
jgi:Putative transposase DNA-binding domain/WD40-like Beta Propeller Repeat